MRLNTIIQLPDGRIGTICYHFLDGDGGIWGEHHFEMPASGFGDSLPQPEFMLREKKLESLLRRNSPHRLDVECVGEQCTILEKP